MFDRAGEAAGCGVIDGASSAKNSIRSISEMRLPEQMTAAVPTVRVSYSLQALQIQFGPGLQSFHLQAEETIFLTLRVSPSAHPERMPRRVALIREVQEHAVEQRGGAAAIFRMRRTAMYDHDSKVFGGRDHAAVPGGDDQKSATPAQDTFLIAPPS